MRLDPVAPDGGLRYTDWSNVPYVNGNGSDFNLNSNDAENANPNWSSPVVHRIRTICGRRGNILVEVLVFPLQATTYRQAVAKSSEK